MHVFNKIICVYFLVFVCASLAYADKNAKSPEKMFYESLSLHKQGKVREAVDKLEAVYQLDPDNPNVVANLAQFAGESGQNRKAVKYYRILMRLEPDNVAAEAGHALYRSILYAKNKRYAEGAAVLKSVVDKVPDNTTILWNLALFSVLSGQHKSALEYWKQFSNYEPDNMLIQSKIIQAYQALEDRGNRDREIQKIFQMYERNADPNFIRQNRFCREQYALGDWRVFVFQFFKPGEKNKYFYRYSVTDKSGNEKFWLSLGSYQTTTEIAREMGSISDSERIYHLDYYESNLHSTKGMYTKKPAYDDLRPATRKIIINEIKKHQMNKN